MTYEYSCSKCEKHFDVIKSYRFMDETEHCSCGGVGVRLFVPSRLYFNGTAVQHTEYNPGLGCLVRNKEHRAELCKIKGVEEVGSEPVASLHKHHDKTRELKREQIWEDATKGWVGNGDVP